ncbi:MAG: hypothetical protein ACRDRB_07555 [Pseudonocardiaceae bacterium]
MVILDTVINDDVVHRFQASELDYVKVAAQFRRAHELDAEAAYYRHRAMQQEQARGPGYYVGLLRALATDRAAMAQRLRTGIMLNGPSPPLNRPLWRRTLPQPGTFIASRLSARPEMPCACPRRRDCAGWEVCRDSGRAVSASGLPSAAGALRVGLCGALAVRWCRPLGVIRRLTIRHGATRVPASGGRDL